MPEPQYTPEEQAIIAKINAMDHFSMCALWRRAPTGHICFDNSKPFAAIFEQRLFKHFGGFTSEISKDLGWN